jgi:hypothetical protein
MASSNHAPWWVASKASPVVGVNSSVSAPATTAGELRRQLAVLGYPQLLRLLRLRHVDAALLAVPAWARDLVLLALAGVERQRVGPPLHGAAPPAPLELLALLVGPGAPEMCR